MSVGRVASSGCALLAVAAGAALVVGMAQKNETSTTDGQRREPVGVTATGRPSEDELVTVPSGTPDASTPTRAGRAARTQASDPTTTAVQSPVPTASSAPATPDVPVPPVAVASTAPVGAAATHAATAPSAPTAKTPAGTPAKPPAKAPARPATKAPVAKPHCQSLPLRYTTGNATRVITVTARSTGSTVATLQAWNKAAGGGWTKYGSAVTAHLGSQGMSSHPSESKSASPMGSFTLTQAFGARSDPGTSLPYTHTDSGDWWISQPGPLYNTHRHCTSRCKFTQGDPNEHLYYETPYYNYAVVIDYNTANAPGGVRQGAGSAFFLHVTDGNPTAGCVSISQARLITIMKWLTPSAHPRILIGTA